MFRAGEDEKGGLFGSDTDDEKEDAYNFLTPAKKRFMLSFSLPEPRSFNHKLLEHDFEAVKGAISEAGLKDFDEGSGVLPMLEDCYRIHRFQVDAEVRIIPDDTSYRCRNMTKCLKLGFQPNVDSKDCYEMSYYRVRAFVSRKILEKFQQQSVIVSEESSEWETSVAGLVQSNFLAKAAAHLDSYPHGLVYCYITCHMRKVEDDRAPPSPSIDTIDPDFNFGGGDLETFKSELRLLSPRMHSNATSSDEQDEVEYQIERVLQFSPVTKSLDYDGILLLSEDEASVSFCNRGYYNIFFRCCSPREMGSSPLLVGLDFAGTPWDDSTRVIDETFETNNDSDDDEGAEEKDGSGGDEVMKKGGFLASMIHKLFTPSTNSEDDFVSSRYYWTGSRSHHCNRYIFVLRRWSRWFLVDMTIDNSTCAGWCMKLKISERAALEKIRRPLQGEDVAGLLKNNFREQWFPKSHPLADAQFLDESEDDYESDNDRKRKLT